MAQPIVFDVETQLTFRDAKSSDPSKLKVSMVGVYDYSLDKYISFTEQELIQMFPLFENASLVIGFNINHFDLQVLKPYYVGDVRIFPTLDLLEEIEKNLGFRLSLDDLVRETLGSPKKGHGLLAIDYFRNNEIEKLRNYCLSDVKLTKELYEYGKQYGKVYYKNAAGRQEIRVAWNKTGNVSSSVNLTLPW
ncbi:ribonuclease H-like domain-containing protein [Candidatus Gottesmanbacteria bacterium]|nr:ribonuclease H-like domain-containing protein [Candidatus Gottesmanbacteria bacterium]